MIGDSEAIQLGIVRISPEKSASRQRLSVAAGAFIGTNPTGEVITFGLPVIRAQSREALLRRIGLRWVINYCFVDVLLVVLSKKFPTVSANCCGTVSMALCC